MRLLRRERPRRGRVRRAKPRRRALVALGLALVLLAGVAATQAGATPGAWWQPPQKLTWFWQLQGEIDNAHAVAAYDVDGFETGAGEVATLHAEGKRVICYIDVGTAESFRPDYSLFPKSVLGRPNGWPGEKWLDIRRLGAIEPIIAARFRMCREKGFDAVEPDNIEAFSNKSGFPITPRQQLAFNEWVASEAHSLGMAVLQKNDGEQAAQLQPYFDGALTEQCNEYSECADFAPYLAAGEPVLNAEYREPPKKFCAADDAAGIMGVRYALSLNGKKFEAC